MQLIICLFKSYRRAPVCLYLWCLRRTGGRPREQVELGRHAYQILWEGQPSCALSALGSPIGTRQSLEPASYTPILLGNFGVESHTVPLLTLVGFSVLF